MYVWMDVFGGGGGYEPYTFEGVEWFISNKETRRHKADICTHLDSPAFSEVPSALLSFSLFREVAIESELDEQMVVCLFSCLHYVCMSVC